MRNYNYLRNYTMDLESYLNTSETRSTSPQHVNNCGGYEFDDFHGWIGSKRSLTLVAVKPLPPRPLGVS